MTDNTIPRLLDRVLPRTTRRAIMRQVKVWTARPRVGGIDFGDLRRLSPVCRDWGYSRGTPIDRHYVHRFMERHAADVRGRVLEIGTDELTRQYGGGRVMQSDVLHVADGGPPVTIVANLEDGVGIPAAAFDCAIVTQTLQFIYDVHGAVRSLHRLLKPGGIALVTVPGITKISPEDLERWGHYWSLTHCSAQRLFEEAFPGGSVTVKSGGNVLSATAFLQGIAVEELNVDELDYEDSNFEVLLGIRAQKGPA
jgi:SAM-dependent methyltransferase